MILLSYWMSYLTEAAYFVIDLINSDLYLAVIIKMSSNLCCKGIILSKGPIEIFLIVMPFC